MYFLYTVTFCLSEIDRTEPITNKHDELIAESKCAKIMAWIKCIKQKGLENII